MEACKNFGTIEQEKAFFDLLKENLNNKTNAMEVLQKTQGIYGFIPKQTIAEISKYIKVSEVKLYGIISFYSQFTLIPKAKYNIDICLGTACFVAGSETILQKVKSLLNLEVGQITEDNKWLISTCRCIGCCGLAPAISINGKVYGHVTPQIIEQIIKGLE